MIQEKNNSLPKTKRKYLQGNTLETLNKDREGTNLLAVSKSIKTVAIKLKIKNVTETGTKIIEAETKN